MTLIKWHRNRLILLLLGFTFLTIDSASQEFNPLNKSKEIQLGLSGIASYGRAIFANALFQETRGWRAVDAANTPVDSEQIGADGYPVFLKPGQVLFAHPGHDASANCASYAGRICVTWEGEADIRLPNARFCSSPSLATGSVVNGKRYYDNGLMPDGVRVEIVAINPKNPPKNIKVWLNDSRNPAKSLDPAEQNGKEYLLNPAFSSRFGVDAFFMYRFMDMTDTNHSDIAQWSDRRSSTHCFQKGKINGVDVGMSYELILDICNTSGKDLWINIPAKADEEFVKKLAMLIDGDDPDHTGCKGLNKNLRCYVEYANEVGWSYWADYCTSKAKTEGLPSGRHFAAMQKARVASWFRSVVGENNERFKMVQCIQTGSMYFSDIEMDITCKSYGPTLKPSGVPDFMGVTAYVSNQMEQFVFDELNYWDKKERESQLNLFFNEFERRALSGGSTVSGVDFTSGISSVAKDLRTTYGKPIVIYEGGCGMSLTHKRCAKDCKIVPTNTMGANCNSLKKLADSCGGSDNYVNFIREAHKHPLMAKMFDICFSLSKAEGVESLSQFGDVQDVEANIDYGYWACMNDLSSNPPSALRYQFWLKWFKEQRQIREIGSPAGASPQFFSAPEIEPFYVNKVNEREILFGNGDGKTEVKLISRKETLPSRVKIEYQSGKIIISGKPLKSDQGNYFLLFRLLDQDNDPAYRVFKLNIV
ncbi:MAG: hypothetical protein PHV20_03720 [Bacteroidales bacterium]|nr:hypothetical protein [Bacteroidales bacterium]